MVRISWDAGGVQEWVRDTLYVRVVMGEVISDTTLHCQTFPQDGSGRHSPHGPYHCIP